MYQALYRKWRPKTFSDVVGQEHVTETLQRQVAEGRLSHAYLFTGTRGTGKTTCAKILAKAVNCEHPENGNPCNKCSSCLGIESGGFLDVMELDAASNNGVDHVRALRDEAIYSPAQVKKRVYIIDEVHMLSIAAFNALLKILEEPPEHLMFILATTELHKVPATILSRCQRFAFRRILPREIVGRLNYIAEQEGIDLRPDGAELLAHIADGALRDALSLLDQCAAAGGTDRQRGGARRAGTGGQPPDRAADGLRSAARHEGRAAVAPPALRQRQGCGRGARRAVRARTRPAHFQNGSRGRRGAAHGRLRRPDDGQPFAAGRQRAAYRHLHHAPARGGGHERERQPPHGCGAVSPEALRRNALRRPERHQRSPRAARTADDRGRALCCRRRRGAGGEARSRKGCGEADSRGGRGAAPVGGQRARAGGRIL